ncbi:hypothetical protein K458DRAFT_409964 [Lentithecium fluviatile CBS 122367]|uniref:Uncharacterized protein n=1 Tax=Lentithecium fluviatile CBS 122367 TaxID=1168545 RepID=A0A6G1IFR7_9PLEO|nr:hypothetical protein K458DRAFT_409964 [Lentithecium fluviatile CBS 122367]
MQFTTSVLALFATTALALPGSPVQERQATPTAYLQFWNPPASAGNTCDRAPQADDFVITQDMTSCTEVTITNPYKTANITGNTLTRTARLFELPGCNNAGTHFDVSPRTDYNCFVQTIKSVIIL